MKCMGKINVKVCKAECCGLVPLRKEFIEKHKNKMRRGARFVFSTAENTEVWAKNGSCAFLSKHFKCLVYEDRPHICRIMASEETDHPFLKCLHLGQITAGELDAHFKQQWPRAADWDEYHRLEKLGEMDLI